VSSSIALVDPFALTVSPQAYVPRPACERALAELLRALREQGEPLALAGPPGLGKTLLLHLLAERVAGLLRPVYLPYPALSPEELCTCVLAVLGPAAAEEPIAALQASIRSLHEEGSALLLLVDDADAMPLPTARWLGELAERSRAALRLVIAATERAASSRTIAALGPAVRVTRLVEPMSEAEALEYVARRLAAAGVPQATRERFDPPTVRDLHRICGGNPRRLHIAAAAVLRGRPPELPEDWIVDTGAARPSSSASASGQLARGRFGAGEVPDDQAEHRQHQDQHDP
jgi:type II secretory pathway predicted ATPase ExeA